MVCAPSGVPNLLFHPVPVCDLSLAKSQAHTNPRTLARIHGPVICVAAGGEWLCALKRRSRNYRRHCKRGEIACTQETDKLNLLFAGLTEAG